MSPLINSMHELGKNVSARWICICCALVLSRVALEARTSDVSDDMRRIRHVVDDLTGRLGLAAPVEPAIVESNPLLVSVEAAGGRKGQFVLNFERSFLRTLNDEELRAVVAHELGHVWIFTHHPYLQTERGANQIAMRVVSRASLERVYAKVWERGGAKGDLARFLDE